MEILGTEIMKFICCIFGFKRGQFELVIEIKLKDLVVLIALLIPSNLAAPAFRIER